MSAAADIWLGGGARPLMLEGPNEIWRVELGYANIFWLDEHDVRHHLFRVDRGDVMVGGRADCRLVAVGSLESRFARIDGDALDVVAATPWATRLAHALQKPLDTRPASSSQEESRPRFDDRRTQNSSDVMKWVCAEGGAGRLNGVAALPPGSWIAFPPRAWLEAEEPVAISEEPPANASLRETLDGLSDLVVEALGAAARTEAALREEARLVARRRSQDALSHGLALLTGQEEDHARPVSGADSLTVAMTILCRAIGHTGPQPSAPSHPGGPGRLEEALAQTKLTSRPIVLGPGWWKNDGSPMLGRTDDGVWVALLPRSRGGWRAASAEGESVVDPALASRISADAVQIYPALPGHPIGFRDLLTLAGRGIRRDVATIATMGLAGGIAALSIPLASRALFDDVVPLGDQIGLYQILAGLTAVALGIVAFEFVKAAALLRIEARLDANLQAALFDRLLRLPVGFFRQFTAGDLAQRTLGFQRARELLSGSALTGVLSLVFALANFGVMAAIDLRLAAIALPVSAGITGISYLLVRTQLKHERQRADAKGRTDGFMLQLLVGIGKLRASAAETRGLAQWAFRMGRERRAIYATQRMAAVQEVAQSMLPGVATMVIFLSVVAFAKSDIAAAKLAALVDPVGAASLATISIGSFIAFATAFALLTAALSTAALSLTQLLAVAPLLERTRPLLEASPEVTEHGVSPARLRGGIDLRGVSFRYEEDGPLALSSLSLSVEPGEFVAIVGPSGSGKSTILRLLLGFEKAERGEIFFDGTAIERFDMRELRMQIGIVLQNGRITAGSLFDNIVGTAEQGLDDAWAAARLVNLAEDIEAMPMGMHTVLPDGGRTLSGGQRQRVLLARALVRRPSILLLDEATSALDNRTQSVVTETLASLSVTRVVIAHRLSTIREVDRILVIEGGRLVETGGYEELMALDGAFAALARRQLL